MFRKCYFNTIAPEWHVRKAVLPPYSIIDNSKGHHACQSPIKINVCLSGITDFYFQRHCSVLVEIEVSIN